MYLTVHAAAGALIGNYINNSPIAFLLGLLSHFILDAIPHHDGNIPTGGHDFKSIKKLYLNKIIALMYLDFCLAIIVVAALLTGDIHFFSKPIIWGMAGAVLPDIILILSMFWPRNKLLKKINEFHDHCHYSPVKPISLIIGNLTQLVTLIIIVTPLT